MTRDWDDAYSNGAHIANGAAYPPAWAEAAAAFRAARPEARLDIPYGAAPRERFDLFAPPGEARGLLVFVHGGYWMAFDKSTWSHLATGALSRGWAVAMPSYTLAPEAKISAITRQIGAAIEAAAAMVPGEIRLTGHSAGGHLAARMLCADTPLCAETRTRIARVVPISGLHDLRPLQRTAMNETLRLDDAEAEAESPALQRPIATKAEVVCWVGAAERPEFVRQNDLLTTIWGGFDLSIRGVHAPGRHHFDVIADLERADSALAEALAG